MIDSVAPSEMDVGTSWGTNTDVSSTKAFGLILVPFQSLQPELTGRGFFLEVESDYMSTSSIRGRIEASWREMFITNPPITTLNFAGCIHLRGQKPEFCYPEFCVHDRGGIT